MGGKSPERCSHRYLNRKEVEIPLPHLLSVNAAEKAFTSWEQSVGLECKEILEGIHRGRNIIYKSVIITS